MSACPDFGPLLAERAAGPLPAADEARLASHLSGCSGCRAELARLRRVLELVRAPVASAEEERGAADLPLRILAAARRPARAPLLRWAVPLVAATAAALAFLVPAVLQRRGSATPAQPAASELAASAWEAPDPDAMWEWSAALEAEDDADLQ
jgi:anti-sigma factor RsiW